MEMTKKTHSEDNGIFPNLRVVLVELEGIRENELDIVSELL